VGQHKETRRIVHRLARIEGHVRAVRRMVEEERACAEVLVQLAAVKAGVEKVAQIILSDHFESCLIQASRGGEREKALTDLREALDRFLR
jgi:DNA-binding FrmR family transcriptional regulator